MASTTNPWRLNEDQGNKIQRRSTWSEGEEEEDLNFDDNSALAKATQRTSLSRLVVITVPKHLVFRFLAWVACVCFNLVSWSPGSRLSCTFKVNRTSSGVVDMLTRKRNCRMTHITKERRSTVHTKSGPDELSVG